MNKSSIRKYKLNSIFMSVFRNYAGLLLIFALVLGFIFIRLFTQNTQNHLGNQVEHVAGQVAGKLRNYVVDEDYIGAYEYIQNFSDLEEDEIWILANPKASHPLDDSLVSINIEEDEIQEEFAEVAGTAFSGEAGRVIFYSDMHEATAMVVSMPITGANQEICGAVLLISTMKSLDDTLSSSRQMILISSITALVIAFIVALIFARQITAPITRMREVTQQMTEGDYKVKTGIRRKDEIGDMAVSVDTLADKLLETETARRNMEQMRLDFFANVSHELRTPIAVVRAYTESLVDGVVTDPDKVEQYHGRMLAECKSMERLVGDLLTLSKMQNPDFQVEKEPVNLVHIFDEIIRSATAIGEEKKIKIKMQRERDVYMMLGDYDRLRQMFMVIFDNAIKFSNDNSSIYVTITSADKLRISIRDEGVGISEEELPNIFEKFYKSKLRQNAKGTGLGLAIAKYIALKHDGNIEVNSKVGEGTEFVFSFNEVSEEELENMM